MICLRFYNKRFCHKRGRHLCWTLYIRLFLLCFKLVTSKVSLLISYNLIPMSPSYFPIFLPSLPILTCASSKFCSFSHYILFELLKPTTAFSVSHCRREQVVHQAALGGNNEQNTFLVSRNTASFAAQTHPRFIVSRRPQNLAFLLPAFSMDLNKGDEGLFSEFGYFHF